jgi:hypothetical protein
MTLKEQICTATDTLDSVRRAYYQQQASYDEMTAAARRLLELRQQAELAFMGKVKTKITSVAIASLIR